MPETAAAGGDPAAVAGVPALAVVHHHPAREAELEARLAVAHAAKYDVFFVALSIVSPFSSLWLWFIMKGELDKSDTLGYITYVGYPRLISFLTVPPVLVWLTRRKTVPRNFQCCCKCPCPAWWMIVQALFMGVYGWARGTQEEFLVNYEGQHRENRVTYLTLLFVGCLPDIGLGLFWLYRLARQDGVLNVCCRDDDKV
jgi:hypothetical protein